MKGWKKSTAPGNCRVLLLVTGWLCMRPVYADLIVLKNGDRMTGDIQEIWDHEVIVEPEYDDDTAVTISLDVVDYIESSRDFEIKLRDGRKVIAKLAGRDIDGNQLIEINGKLSTITYAELEELDEIADYYDRDSRIDFNLALNKGNTDSLNTKLYVDTNLKLGDHRHIVDLTLIREEQDNSTTRDNGLLRYNYNWLFADPWFFGGNASVERDPVRDLDHRFILGGSIGRDIWNKPRRAMNFQIGLGYLTEKFSSSEAGGTPVPSDSNDSLVLSWQYRFRYDLFGGDLEIYHNNTLNSTATGRKNTVIKTVTGARYEITDLLYLNAAIDFDWESHPAGTAKNEDLAVTVGLGVEF